MSIRQRETWAALQLGSMHQSKSRSAERLLAGIGHSLLHSVVKQIPTSGTVMRLAGSGVSMRDSRSFAAGLALGMGLVMPEWMRG
jgi:hypothetical protein